MVTRRLVAVLCADVAGFSRLAERDESRTHARLAEIRTAVFDPAIASHGGRLVKTMGDGLLVEFASATSAVRCAVEVQRAMARRNIGAAEDDRIAFRIGINAGDIIVDGDDIFGDGVNVASRLEGLADPGAIAASATLWEQVREDVGVDAVDGGDVHVKSIERPIHVIHLVPRAHGSKARARLAAWQPLTPPARQLLAFVVTVAVLALAAVAGWRLLAPGPAADAGTETSSRARSMVILPFAVVGGDPDALPLAAALSTEFARLVSAGMRDWRIAEPPAMPPSGTRAIAEAARVRYVVAGELQRLGGETSLTVRIVDGAAEKRVATEQRRLPANEALELREVALAGLVRSVRAALNAEEMRREKPMEKPRTASDFVTRARHRLATASGADTRPLQEALSDFDEALRRTPSLADAWIGKAQALTFVRGYTFGNDVDPAAIGRSMDEASLRAVEIDPRDPRAWDARMWALIAGGRWDAAFDANDRAMELDPTDGGLQAARALLLIFTGRLDEALTFARERVARDPALAPHFRFIECRVLLGKGQYQDAIPVCERNASTSSYVEQMFLTSLYAATGNLERAQVAKARMLDLAPGLTIAQWRARAPAHPEFQRQLDDHIVPGLRKAGVPE